MWHNCRAFSFRLQLGLYINFYGFVSNVEWQVSFSGKAYFFQAVCVREENSCIEASSTHLLPLYDSVVDFEGLLHAV